MPSENLTEMLPDLHLPLVTSYNQVIVYNLANNYQHISQKKAFTATFAAASRYIQKKNTCPIFSDNTKKQQQLYKLPSSNLF